MAHVERYRFRRKEEVVRLFEQNGAHNGHPRGDHQTDCPPRRGVDSGVDPRKTLVDLGLEGTEIVLDAGQSSIDLM